MTDSSIRVIALIWSGVGGVAGRRNGEGLIGDGGVEGRRNGEGLIGDGGVSGRRKGEASTESGVRGRRLSSWRIFFVGVDASASSSSGRCLLLNGGDEGFGIGVTDLLLGGPTTGCWSLAVCAALLLFIRTSMGVVGLLGPLTTGCSSLSLCASFAARAARIRSSSVGGGFVKKTGVGGLVGGGLVGVGERTELTASTSAGVSSLSWKNEIILKNNI